MEHEVERRLISESLSAQSVTRPTYKHIVKDPWLATSALQKAIRRGLTADAMQAVSFLLDTQPDKLWRRLVVISMEDIGITDLDHVSQTLWVSGKRAWRREHCGEWAIASSIVSRLCGSVKCRDACDLLVIADWHPDFGEQRVNFAQISDHDLADVVTSHREPLPARALAAWYLAGTGNYPAGNLRERAGKFAILLEIYEHLGVPPEVLQAASWGSTRTREAHAVTLPLIWLSHSSSNWSEVRREEMSEPSMVGGWLSAAFDMHTRPGKRAIAYFIKSCTPVRELLLRYVPESEVFDLASILIFRVEGAQVDRRLVYDGSENLLRLASEGQIARGSLPIRAVPEMLDLMRTHLPDLYQARKKIAAAIQGWEAKI